MRHLPLVAALVSIGAIVAACGGSGASKSTATTTTGTAAAQGNATRATASTSSATIVSSPTVAAPGATVPPPATAASGGASNIVFNDTQARALLDAASITPKDAGVDWVSSSDTSTDNAAAATADPSSAASNDRCGRLLGRLVVSAPKDTVSAYLGGNVASVFSLITVYKTAAGAADCAAEAGAKLTQPGQLARAFGAVFTHPDAVIVQPVSYPTVGDNSFAAALTGDINANGTTVQLQIVIVGFLKGNTSAVVGVAYAPLSNPSTAELKPYVDLVLQRIAANQ